MEDDRNAGAGASGPDQRPSKKSKQLPPDQAGITAYFRTKASGSGGGAGSTGDALAAAAAGAAPADQTAPPVAAAAVPPAAPQAPGDDAAAPAAAAPAAARAPAVPVKVGVVGPSGQPLVDTKAVNFNWEATSVTQRNDVWALMSAGWLAKYNWSNITFDPDAGKWACADCRAEAEWQRQHKKPITVTGLAVDGSCRITMSAINEHNKSSQHNRILADKAQRERHAASSSKAVEEASPFLMVLMRTALAAGKTLQPLSRYTESLTLQRLNGVPHIHEDSPYQNDHKAAEFISVLSEATFERLVVELKASPFVSIETDESNDLATFKSLITYITYIGADGEPSTAFLDLRRLDAADAAAVFDKLESSLMEAGVEWRQVINCVTDGASTMTGAKSGVATRIKRCNPWCITYLETSDLVASFDVMHPANFPASARAAAEASYGEGAIDMLAAHFGTTLAVEHPSGASEEVAPPFDGAALRREWPKVVPLLLTFKDRLLRSGAIPRAGTLSLYKFWAKFITVHHLSYPSVCTLARILLVLRASSAACERGFSIMKLLKNQQRCSLGDDMLDALLRVYELGPAVGTAAAEEVCADAVALFNGGNRRPGNSRQGPRPPRASKHTLPDAAMVEDPVSGLRLVV